MEALTIMLTTAENMTIKNSPCVTRSKVYDKLMPYVAYECGELNIQILQDVVINDYMKASQENTIRNPLNYMKACIWNVLQIGDITMQTQLKSMGY